VILEAYNSLERLQMSLKGKESPVLDGFTGEQRIFLGWGQVWLDKAREDDLRGQLTIRIHLQNSG
jgi:putative endopeptidase